MSGIWKRPEKTSFEKYVERNPGESGCQTKNGTQCTEPMPDPKEKSEFTAWREYLGMEKDEQLIGWKKRQVGEPEGGKGGSPGKGKSGQSKSSAKK